VSILPNIVFWRTDGCESREATGLQADVGKNRAEVSAAKLRDLNPCDPIPGAHVDDAFARNA
jgi:hypothetical protein